MSMTRPIAARRTRRPGASSVLGLTARASATARPLEGEGRKTGDGAFAFHGTTRSADVSPSPTSHNTIKVTVDLRVRGSSGARGLECVYPSPARLSAARSVSEAEAILHRAGIFAGYGGEAQPVRARAALLLPVGQPLRALRIPASRPSLYRLAGSLRVRSRMHVRRYALAALASIPGGRSSLR